MAVQAGFCRCSRHVAIAWRQTSRSIYFGLNVRAAADSIQCCTDRSRCFRFWISPLACLRFGLDSDVLAMCERNCNYRSIRVCYVLGTAIRAFQPNRLHMSRDSDNKLYILPRGNLVNSSRPARTFLLMGRNGIILFCFYIFCFNK